MPPMERLRYKPLDRESGAIRLVRLLPGTDEPIRLELIPSNLDQESCIPYETLSYARGFFNEGRAVEVDGQQLTITRNGSLALLSLRRANEDLILWVEEICINQSDHEEKLRQKRKLKTIYDRAERLFMWLADSTSEEAQLSQLPTLPTIIHGNKVHVVEIGPGSPSWQSGLHQVTADTVSCSTGASSPAGPSEIICDTDGCVAIFSGMYRKDNLARHKRLKHKGPVVYECEDLLCDRVFYSRDVRTKHYRRWHPSLAGMSMHQYSDYFRHAELRELLPVSGDEPDFLGGKSGGGSQVALTDDNISSTKNSHTFINSSSDREEFDGMTKVSLGESHRVLDAWVQQQKFEDVDVQSLVSEEGDAASSTSMPLPSWARETELTIVGVFANSSILSPLYSRALQLMPEERFINNFRRLLKAFHGNLVASDNSNVTRQLAKLLKSKQRQSRIARMVVARHVALQSSWNEEDLATLRDQEKQAYTNVEGWLDRTIVSSAIIDTQADRSGDMDKEFESGNDSDSESNGEENMSHFAQYPRLDLAVQRLVEGRPFQDMLASFKELLLPPGLLKELLPIPRDSVTYGTTEETGLLSTVQGFFLEEITALEWDWWPLSPRMRPLKPSETRVHWKCFCGTNRWRELRMEQQEILDEVLKESSADNHPRPLCALLRDTKSASCMKTSSVSQHPASQPHQNASPNTHIPASSNAAPPSLGTQAMRSQPGSNAASQAGGNGPVQPTSASSSSSQSSSGNNSAYNKQLWVNFGVDGSWTPTELDQLGGLNLVSDSAFLRNLGRRHREIRGWFRHYFSFRIISYWEFLRFKRLPLLPPQTIDLEADLPTSSDYEYDPRPPHATRDKPGITKHEFEVYVRLCLDPCWLSSLLIPHKCRTVEDSAVDIVDKIPKYKKLLEQRAQGEEHVWGIRARYVVSGIRVVALHIAILCISFGVWIWWQWKHPDDLQGAAVALTAAFLLISTFWSATGVLRDLR